MTCPKKIFPDENTILKHKQTVISDWTDYNGHMNVAYYMRSLDLALEAFFAESGLQTINNTHRTMCSKVEYRKEIHQGKTLISTVQLIEATDTKIHILQTVREEGQEEIAAIAERIETLDPSSDLPVEILQKLADQQKGFALPEGWTIFKPL